MARALLGCVIQQPHEAGPIQLRIVETEGYLPGDTASHANRGQTPRNTPMFGPAGYTYVYLCYGIHQMLNVVSEAEGVPGAVLIRGCEVLAGHDQVQVRRKGKLDLIGPGKVGQALALSTADTAQCLLTGPLQIFAGSPPAEVITGPRVGIDYAAPADRDAPWRFQASAGPCP